MNFADTEKENEKGNFPPTPPYKEKEKEKALKATVSESELCARESVQDTDTDSDSDSSAIRDNTDSAGCRHILNTDSDSVRRRPFKIDAGFILSGDMGNGRRNDPVQMAMKALKIPRISYGKNGTPYSNPGLLRWYMRNFFGEDTFRQLVYQQWRENEIDGMPENPAAAFMSKLWHEKEKLLKGGAR